jgi:hypothetical protein
MEIFCCLLNNNNNKKPANHYQILQNTGFSVTVSVSTQQLQKSCQVVTLNGMPLEVIVHYKAPDGVYKSHG